MAEILRSQQGYAGSLRWDTRKLNADTIMAFDKPTIMACKAQMVELAREMSAWMKEHRQWEDHPERHPSPHWPSRRTAQEGLFTRVRGVKVLRLDLGFSPSTIYVKATGDRYNYGRKLEQTRPIIVPTLHHFAGQFVGIMANVLTNEAISIPDIQFGGDESTV